MKNLIHKEQVNKAGIYKITNVINGKYYLGSSKNISSRYRSHLYTLKNNKSTCRILQNAVIKYGLINFVFEVIEICENYEERESILIKNLNPKYNIIQETVIKRIISEETKKRMSESAIESYKNGRIVTSNKGKKYNRKVKSHIILYNKDITLTYTNVEECAKKFNCSVQALYNCYYKNYLFQHKYKIKIIKP